MRTKVSEAKRLKQLEEENRKPKRIVTDEALDIAMLKDVAGQIEHRTHGSLQDGEEILDTFFDGSCGLFDS